MDINNVTVIGAGTMGNGIAHVFAQFGFHVTLNDVQPEFVERGIQTISGNLVRQVKKNILTEQQKNQTLERISQNTNLEEAVRRADIVIEAATENKTIKKQIFQT